MAKAPAIAPVDLQALAEREPVVVIGVGVLSPGAIDPALPGDQRTASLRTLADVVADVPRARAIVLHCG
jgi:hypothetical protein